MQTLCATGSTFDRTTQNWVLNLITKTLAKNAKYSFRIKVNDASAIDFSFSVK